MLGRSKFSVPPGTILLLGAVVIVSCVSLFSLNEGQVLPDMQLHFETQSAWSKNMTSVIQEGEKEKSESLATTSKGESVESVNGQQNRSLDRVMVEEQRRATESSIDLPAGEEAKHLDGEDPNHSLDNDSIKQAPTNSSQGAAATVEESKNLTFEGQNRASNSTAAVVKESSGPAPQGQNTYIKLKEEEPSTTSSSTNASKESKNTTNSSTFEIDSPINRPSNNVTAINPLKPNKKNFKPRRRSPDYQQKVLPPLDVIDSWKARLDEHNLTRSARHQARFHAQKHLLFQKVPESKLIPAETWNYGASVLSSDYSFLHVWKCGGTTVGLQPGNKGNYATGHKKVKATKYFVTFVRDPIDHFFSGWSECRGRRDKQYRMRQNKLRREMGFTLPQDVEKRSFQNMTKFQLDWNQALHVWLNETRRLRQWDRGALCNVHSYPQANFFMAPEKPTYLLPVALVAELKEMSHVLGLIDGFPFDPTTVGRNATADKNKKREIPPLSQWLSSEMLVEICEFVALDYLLFDFEPPKECSFLRDENYHFRELNY